jgi:hypothetical protein
MHLRPLPDRRFCSNAECANPLTVDDPFDTCSYCDEVAMEAEDEAVDASMREHPAGTR